MGELSEPERDADRVRPGLTAVDLFAGPGGTTTGLKAAGFTVLAAVEVEHSAAATYSANHPEVVMFVRDIRGLPARDVLEALGVRAGELDLLAGCPPCQGFSTLTTLNGAYTVDDPRNDLIEDYVRYVRVLRPKALLMENVPGLLADRRMLVAIDTLERLGYPVRDGSRIVNAGAFGVAQNRRRMVMMAGYRLSIPAPEPSAARTVRDILEGLPAAGSSGDTLHDHGERRSKHIRSLIRRIPKDGGSRSDLPAEDQLPCHRKTRGFYDIYGRMSWDRPAPTITSGCTNPSKGRFLHPSEDRAITLREAALLQGFPCDYKFDLAAGKEAIAEMIGNALPPPFVKAHAGRIAEALRPVRSDPRAG